MATIKLLSSILLNQVYPIGSIYMSVNNSSPASFLGGTWQRIQGRFLYGVVDDDTNYAANKEGGSASVSHYHYTTTGADSGIIYFSGPMSEEKKSRVVVANRARIGIQWEEGAVRQDSTTNTSIPTMPLYLCVYIWKRTA